MEIQPCVSAFGLIRRSSAEPCVASFPATDSLTHKTHPSTTSTFTRPPCQYQTTLCTHTHLASWPAVQTTNPLCVATGMQRRVCLSTCNKKLGVCVCVSVNKLKGYLGIFSPSLFHNDSSMSLCTLLLFCNLCSSSTKAPEV